MRIKSYAFSRIWGCLMATLHYWRHSLSYKAKSCSSIKLLVTSLAGMRAELIAPSQQQERERDCNNWPRPCRGWPPAVAFIYFGLAGACLVYFPLVTCVDLWGLAFLPGLSAPRVKWQNLFFFFAPLDFRLLRGRGGTWLIQTNQRFSCRPIDLTFFSERRL